MKKRFNAVQFVALVAFIALAGAPAALADVSIVLQQGLDGYTGTSDAYLRSRVDYADRNYGGDGVMFVGVETVAANYYRSLVKFDLSSLVAPENHVFASAELSLYQQRADGAAVITIDVFRIDGAWVEGNSYNAIEPGAVCANYRAYNTVQWSNTADGGRMGDFYDRDASALNETDSPYASLMVDNTLTWKSWDVTDLVSEWLNGIYPNEGFLIQSPDAQPGSSRRFYHSEYASVPERRPKLTITYTPVPEPSTLMVLAGGFAAGVLKGKKRRQV